MTLFCRKLFVIVLLLGFLINFIGLSFAFDTLTFDNTKLDSVSYQVDVETVGSGRITSFQPGINCGTDCDEFYNDGESVKLTAIPDDGYVFSGWSGSDSSSNNQIIISVDSDKIYRATFKTFDDGTGVSTIVQDNAPNNGDGNGDGSKDSLQSNVVSLPSATGSGYITIEVDGCGQIENVTAITYNSIGEEDPGYDYPYGLVDFSLPCSSATVKIYYHGLSSLSGYTFRKYGPMPDDWNLSVWYSMPSVSFNSKTIDGKTVWYVEYDLNEGQLGDDTNGSPIVDPGGIAVLDGNSIPTLSEIGLLMLGLFLIAISYIGIRE